MIASGFAVTLVLVLILLTNEGARVLSRAADNQYPHDVVFALIGLGAVQHLPIFVADRTCCWAWSWPSDGCITTAK